jgi:hypothetical protein
LLQRTTTELMSLPRAQAANISLEVLHRIAARVSGGMDIRSHSGAGGFGALADSHRSR